MSNFVYLVTEPKSREALVIDSGWEIEPILSAVKESECTVKYVVCTHSHFDHVSSIDEVARELGSTVVAHKNSPVGGGLTVVDGDVLRVGGQIVKAIHTPGHTEDSICLYDGRNLFTGDTLFVGTIGKFTRESAEAMFESLSTIMKLPDSTVIYPGHDYGEVPFRTLGEEKAINPFLLIKDLRSFLSLYA
jgi:glyoxylase-like metal-dependent hydrolase (beta-lactamase superfamily II)